MHDDEHFEKQFIFQITPAASRQVAGVITVPFGTVIAYAGTTPPNGWLLCNGQNITQSSYPNLYGLIGGKVPDMRGRSVVGSGQGPWLSNRNIDQTGGTEKEILVTTQLPPHAHNFGVGGGGGDRNGDKTGTDDGFSINWGSTAFKNVTTDVGGNEPHNNMPPFYALNFIIKY